MLLLIAVCNYGWTTLVLVHLTSAVDNPAGVLLPCFQAQRADGGNNIAKGAPSNQGTKMFNKRDSNISLESTLSSIINGIS